jgi:hypothetical protein
MHHTTGVSVCECVGHFAQDPERVADRKLALARQPIAK